VAKIINDHTIFANLLLSYIIFYWDRLSYTLDNQSDCSSILNLTTRRLGIIPNTDEILNGKLLLTFFLVIVKLTMVNGLIKLNTVKHLDILLTKAITYPLTNSTIEEYSISSIFASNMILYLFDNYYNQVLHHSEIDKDNSISSYIKYLINLNCEELVNLQRCCMKIEKKMNENAMKDSDEEEDILEHDLEDNNVNQCDMYNTHSYNYIHHQHVKKPQIITQANKTEIPTFKQKNHFEYDFGGSHSEEEDSYSDDEGSNGDHSSDDDLINGIINENDDDRDDEFIRIKVKLII
jgi:hypothetical protein